MMDGQPKRGDAVESWLRRWRNVYEVIKHGKAWRSNEEWYALNDALEDYRLHADTGTPLDREVKM